MNTHENAQLRAMLADVRTASGILVRPLSAGTLTCLQLLGNPLATYIDAAWETEEAAEAALRRALADRMTMLEFAYLHAAPLEEVCPPLAGGDVATFREHMLAWGMRQPSVITAEVSAAVLGEQRRLEESAWGIIPPANGGHSKNEPAPPSSSQRSTL